MKLAVAAHGLFLSLSVVALTGAFTPSPRNVLTAARSVATQLHESVAEEGVDVADPLGLPEELRKITDAFASVDDDSLRHKQLLYMANQLEPLDPSKAVDTNKVPGCLSTVYVDGKALLDQESGEYVIEFVGDSDGLLTKGLVALLIR